MQIYCVRHGQAASSWEQNTDPGLSEAGLQQAGTLAASWPYSEIKQIISSPMLRTRQTASPLATALDMPVQVNEAFREIPTPPSVPMAHRLQWLQSCARQEWGEMDNLLVQWRSRLLGAITSLQQPTVIFTHFMVMNAIAGHILAREQLVHYQPDYTSILKLDLNHGALSLVELGAQARRRIL